MSQPTTDTCFPCSQKSHRLFSLKRSSVPDNCSLISSRTPSPFYFWKLSLKETYLDSLKETYLDWKVILYWDLCCVSACHQKTWQWTQNRKKRALLPSPCGCRHSLNLVKWSVPTKRKQMQKNYLKRWEVQNSQGKFRFEILSADPILLGNNQEELTIFDPAIYQNCETYCGRNLRSLAKQW